MAEERVQVDVIPASEAVRPMVFKGFINDVHAALQRLAPDQVIRVTTPVGKSTQGIGSSLAHYRKRTGAKIEYWHSGPVYYVARTDTKPGARADAEVPTQCPKCGNRLLVDPPDVGSFEPERYCLTCGWRPTKPAPTPEPRTGPRSRQPSHAGARL